jgi:hypothetical protein
MKKVGFSAGECLCELLQGKVDINDVVMITTATMAKTLDDWIRVVGEYHSMGRFPDSASLGDAIELGKTLWNRGLIHQPRNFGAFRIQSPHAWMDLVHTSEIREKTPALREAWEQVQFLEGLVGGGDPLAENANDPGDY